MKLKELLKELHGYDIKVGAKHCFLYCGECNANTPRTISRLSNSLLKNYKNNKVGNQGITQAKINQIINDFIPFLEREVVEVYDSSLHQNEKIIKVVGMEHCRYWDKEEYQREHKK